jgi:hypothetical protein
MRVPIALLAVAGLVTGVGCGNSERAGAEEARRQAEQEEKARQSVAPPARKLATPVPGHAHVPCGQLIDPAVFQTALGEKEPLTVKDVTKSEPEAAASCSLVRGGKRPSEAEQKALLKKDGRLGVLPGDELCNVTAFCSTIEDAEHFKARCKERKDRDDESQRRLRPHQPVGADDAKLFRLLDADTAAFRSAAARAASTTQHRAAQGRATRSARRRSRSARRRRLGGASGRQVFEIVRRPVMQRYGLPL